MSQGDYKALSKNEPSEATVEEKDDRNGRNDDQLVMYRSQNPNTEVTPIKEIEGQVLKKKLRRPLTANTDKRVGLS